MASLTREDSSSVLEMLREDHEKVKGLFEQFEQAKDFKTKQRIVETVIQELEVHAKLEESLVYPAIREDIDEEDLMDEALEEHHVAKVLMAELKKMTPKSERYEAKFMVLAESVKHHIEEEEGQMMPKAEESHVALGEIEPKLMKQKERLMAKLSDSSGNGRGKRSSPKRSRGGRKR